MTGLIVPPELRSRLLRVARIAANAQIELLRVTHPHAAAALPSSFHETLGDNIIGAFVSEIQDFGPDRFNGELAK